MPNIIEQQDLLKGLPDDRLATLMQNPTGDIPPFLVAAEAQRRQSIRAQFSGGPEESVVDTLTKQMANVPQNIQAPAQQPPQMPPPQQGGVADLQQGMRSGGYVQRYADQGLVSQSIYDPAGSPAEQMAKTYMLLNPGMTYEEAIQRASIGQPIAAPIVSDVAAAQAAKIGGGMGGVGNYSILRGDQSAPASSPIAERSSGVSSASTISSASAYDPLSSIMTQLSRPKTASPTVDPRDPNAGKKETSTDNQAKTDMTVDEYKKYLEDIYGVKAEDSEYIRNKIKEMYSGEERSGWESAQKWFAAAQAAIQPGQTDMQAAINALSALGGGYAEERAADRASRRDMEEALLKQEIADRQYRTETERDIAKDMMKYRISLAEAERDAAAARRAAEKDALKYGTDINIRQAEMFGRSAQKSEDDLVRLVNSLRQNGITDEEIAKNAEVVSLQQRIKELYDRQNDALATSSLGTRRYGEAAGVDLSFEEADGINPIRRVQ